MNLGDLIIEFTKSQSVRQHVHLMADVTPEQLIEGLNSYRYDYDAHGQIIDVETKDVLANVVKTEIDESSAMYEHFEISRGQA